MMQRHGARGGRQTGFTLVELMMAVAILGVGLGFITQMFLNGYQLWKRSLDELLLQQSARRSMAFITRAVRSASPGTVRISTPGGMPKFSQIAFTDGQSHTWVFRQRFKETDVVASASVFAIEYVTQQADGVTATLFLADYVASLSFVYPSFQNVRLLDVGITMQKLPFRDETARAKGPVYVQLVERVLMRNP